MSRLAQAKLALVKKKEEEAKQAAAKPKPNDDTRNLASKVFDTLNPIDGGRSFTTAEPSEEQAKKSGGDQAKDILNDLTSSYQRLGKGTAEVLNDVTGNADKQQAEFTNFQDDQTKQLQETRQKIKAETDPTKKERLQKTADLITQNLLGTSEDRSKRLDEVIDRTDPVKGAAAVGSVGLDVLTAGVGGEAANITGKASSKMAAKRIAENAAKGAVPGAGSGALGAVEENGKDTSVGDVAKGALLGAGVGGVVGGAGAAASYRKPLDERGNIKSPFTIKSNISDDLQTRIDKGAIDSKIDKANPNDLRIGPDSDTGLDLDPAAVEDYKTRIKNGEPIDPIVIQRGDDGADEIMDGAHRVEAAKQLGITDIPTVRQNNNVVMAEKVTPPTVESLSADLPEGMRALAPIEKEADIRTPGGLEVPAKQVAETKAQKGAQFILDDTDRLAKETGIDVTPLDTRIGDALSGKTQKKTISGLGADFKDTLTVAAQTLGKPGIDFTNNLLKGNKFKRDSLEALRDPMVEIRKLNKELTGTGFRNGKSSLKSKEDLGARIGAALDDRENMANYLTNPKEQELFNNYVKVFDYVKDLREKSGLEVLDNYRPWVDMKVGAEPPTWLAEGLTNKKVQTLSRFSKERTKTEAGNDVDNNLSDMIYGYVNSQLNELAYDAPVRKFKADLETLPANVLSNKASLQEGTEYFQTLIQQAVSPTRKNGIEQFVANRTSNVYGAILPFNVKLAIQNKTQKFVANSRVSKGAQRLVKQMDNTDLKDLHSGLVFGDKTVFGELEDVNSKAVKKTGLREKAAKIDPYQRSEGNNVTTSFNKGAAQAILDSDEYKSAIASGVGKKEAAKAALQNEQVRKNAIQRGNTVVNDTQFGASALARPAALRRDGSVLGIPVKALTMFTRFPIGMSQHILEGLKTNNARMYDVLKNGDPRAVPIAEMRQNYTSLLDQMKDSKRAIDAGTDIGIPKEVLDQQIDVVNKNVKIINKELKKHSQIRGGKTAKNLGKMWASTLR